MGFDQRVAFLAAYTFQRDWRGGFYQPTRAQHRQRAHARAVQQREMPTDRRAE